MNDAVIIIIDQEGTHLRSCMASLLFTFIYNAFRDLNRLASRR